MKINVEMDIPIMPNHCPSVFFSCISTNHFPHSSGKKYINMSDIFHMGAPVRGKTIWICVASQTILIKSYWLGIERLACGRGAPDPSGSRSLMSSTAGFTGANLFNKGLARMLQGLIWIQPRHTVCGCAAGHEPFGCDMMVACVFFFFFLYEPRNKFHLINSADAHDLRKWQND